MLPELTGRKEVLKNIYIEIEWELKKSRIGGMQEKERGMAGMQGIEKSEDMSEDV